MPVILDTHVLLGALISSYGPPDALYRAWRAGRFEWVTSTAQLEAIRRASRYPKLRAILTAHRVGTMVNHRRRGLVLTPLSVLPGDIQVDDPDDAFLLAMAAASEADYLVTGDRRAGLLSRENIGRTRIVTPAGFRDAVLQATRARMEGSDDDWVALWTLIGEDWSLLGNKTGATRLGFAVSLKFFEIEARFPRSAEEVSSAAVVCLARQLKLDPALFAHYDWTGRTIRYHRKQVRTVFGFREFTRGDEGNLAEWLVEDVCPVEWLDEQLREALLGPGRRWGDLAHASLSKPELIAAP